MTDFKYIVIPDVHGRNFWKGVVEKYKDENVKIIFLGDYFDPYPYDEDVDTDGGYKNIQEIINLKKENPDKFILLLGNHDLHYFYYGYKLRGSRYTRMGSRHIYELFSENLDCFQMIYSCVINEKPYIFTHAGVTAGWLKYNLDNEMFVEISINENDEAEIKPLDNVNTNDYNTWPDFNQLLVAEDGKGDSYFFDALGNVSVYRGGTYDSGSMVWADCQEHADIENRIPGVVQIFGHTQQESEPLNFDNEIYCLDVRRGFGIKEDGLVYELDGTLIPPKDSKELQEEIKKTKEEREKALSNLSKYAGFFL